MSLLRIDRNPTRRKLRNFGLLWLVFFGILGGWAWLRHQALAAAFWAAAATVPAAGLAAPSFLRAVYLGMACLSLPLGLVISFAALAAIYYLVVTPLGLLMRCFGYDPLHRKFDPAAGSYWVKREHPGDAPSYFRQF